MKKIKKMQEYPKHNFDNELKLTGRPIRNKIIGDLSDNGDEMIDFYILINRSTNDTNSKHYEEFLKLM